MTKVTAIDANTRAVPPARREWSWAAWLFAFAYFFPYPALPIGNNNGLQVSQMAALAAIPFLVARPPGRSFRATLLLLGPLFISTFLNHMFADVPLPDLLVKVPIGLALAVLVIWPADWLADRDLFREVLAAAGAAIVLHSLCGLLQLYSFSKDEFPLLFLYVNPSFHSMQEGAEEYVLYNKRPCCLFPEPSAMAASLGPWTVLLTGLLLDPGLRRRLGWRRAWPVIPPVACGCLLLALSQSGSTFALMAAMLVICARQVWRMVHAPPRPLQLVMVALVLLTVASVLNYAISQLGSGNLDGRIDSSWGLRAASIRMGLTLNLSDLLNVAVGVGPGQSFRIIMSHWSGPPIPKYQEACPICSVAVCYYAETGLLGAAPLLAVLAMAVGAIARSSAVLLGLCALGSWLVGVVVTTSYFSLSPVWLFLGVVLSWDRLFPRAASIEGSMMKKIKVVHVINRLSYGGARQFMLCSLLVRTDRERFKSMVVALVNVLPLAESQGVGIPVRLIGMRPGVPDPRGVVGLARLLHRERRRVVQPG